MNANGKPWYTQWGPFSWYKPKQTGRLEWVNVELTWKDKLILTATLFLLGRRPMVAVTALGRVERRSRYAKASHVRDARFHYDWAWRGWDKF